MKLEKLLEGEFNEIPETSLSVKALRRLLSVQRFHYTRLLNMSSDAYYACGDVIESGKRKRNRKYIQIPKDWLDSSNDFYIVDTPENREAFNKWAAIQKQLRSCESKFKELKAKVKAIIGEQPEDIVESEFNEKPVPSSAEERLKQINHRFTLVHYQVDHWDKWIEICEDIFRYVDMRGIPLSQRPPDTEYFEYTSAPHTDEASGGTFTVTYILPDSPRIRRVIKKYEHAVPRFEKVNQLKKALNDERHQIKKELFATDRPAYNRYLAAANESGDYCTTDW